MFVKTDKQSNIVQYPYTVDAFKQEHRNVSFPDAISNRILADYGVYPVRLKQKPSIDPITQHAYPSDTPELIDGEWWLGWVVGQKDATWMAVELEQKKASVRQTRDGLLTATDWVTIRAIDINTPVDPEWATYRQSLREITQQEGFPWNVVWPTDPTGFTHSEEN